MESHGELASCGAAERRRERRLRQCSTSGWRCGWPCAKLSTTLRLRWREVRTQPQGGQKTHKAGARLGVFEEPEPQARAATVGYVAAAGSLGRPPRLQEEGSVDGTTLRYLLKKSLALKKKEEAAEGGGGGEVAARGAGCAPLCRAAGRLSALMNASFQARKRKRKKKRNKKLPRTSSFSHTHCSHLEIWTFFGPLRPGSFLFGVLASLEEYGKIVFTGR